MARTEVLEVPLDLVLNRSRASQTTVRYFCGALNCRQLTAAHHRSASRPERVESRGRRDHDRHHRRHERARDGHGSLYPLRQLLARMSQDARAVASIAQGDPDRAACEDRQETFATRTCAAGLHALRGSGMFDRLSDWRDLSRSGGPCRYRSAHVYWLFRLCDAVSLRRDHDGATQRAAAAGRLRFETAESFQPAE